MVPILSTHHAYHLNANSYLIQSPKNHSLRTKIISAETKRCSSNPAVVFSPMQFHQVVSGPSQMRTWLVMMYMSAMSGI
jgi:hypothetical protein